MPYIKVDEVSEDYDGELYDEIVTIEERDRLVSERDEARTQRDDAIAKLEGAERERDEAREKYANAFLTSRDKIIERHSNEPKFAETIDELF